MKKFVMLLFLVVTGMAFAQNNPAESEIKNTINIFFEGLHNGDTLVIDQVVNSDFKLQSAFYNKKGTSILQNDTKANFYKALSGKNPEDKWFEKLLSYEILVDGNMASVWTPYEFYVNDNFSHCGVNSFQMFKSNEKWEIVYLIDTKRRRACKAFEG
jgi:hypothetical protein